ncbi:MAG TPA: FliH/SctL family protein [Fimbriimonadaceae bacterium]|nr:FliH/SctL family protein [Fimbriimonadaceae bacterium]
MFSPIITGEPACTSFEQVLKSVEARKPVSKPQRRSSNYERLREEARKEGYEDGFQEGLQRGTDKAYAEIGAAGLKQVDAFAEELNLIANQIHQAMDDWYEQAAQQIAPVAILIAERIIRREVKSGRDSIVDMAREAIAEVTHATSLRIRVNPFDSILMQEHRELMMSIAPQLKEIEIIDDSSIEGGCIVESDGGLIDATIRSKLRALIEGTTLGEADA